MSVKLMIDIEIGNNGGFVVTRYKNNPSAIQRLTGVQQEKEVLAFGNAKELADYIAKFKDTVF